MGFLEFLFGKPGSYSPSDSSGTQSLAYRGSSTALSSKTSVLDIRVGDVVTYDATDFIVRNRYIYSEDGFEWFSYQLVDTITERKLWLDAEDDDELVVAISTPIKLSIEGHPPRSITHNGIRYTLDENSRARVRIESEESAPKEASVEYWDYCDDADETALGIERWSTGFEASVSRYIEPYEVTILRAGH